MVGVGGRSKACDNCYRRRIKCDETKPKCRRCAKAKLDCGGYRSITIILYDGDRTQTEESTYTRNEKRSPEDLQSYVPALSLQDQPTENAADITHPLLLSLGPANDDVFVNYTLSYLLSARNQQHVITGVHRDISDKSFLALSTFFFGNEHRERSVVEHGLRRYGNALQQLNLALGNIKQRQTYDVLESVIFLTMFEYLMSDKPDGWIAHSIGLEQLFEARGPDLFVSYAERTILERSRPTIIFACMVQRKATILSRSEWKTVPWASDPASKSRFELLVDIMADCPGILSLLDKMNSTKYQREKSKIAKDLANQITSLKELLRQWKKGWDIAEPECRWTQTNGDDQYGSRRKTNPRPRQLRYTRFNYKSLYHANVMTMYSGVSIYLEQTLASTSAVISTEGPTGDHLQVAHAAAIDIARSADYCIDNARGGLGSFYILYPLRMAWAASIPCDPDLQAWLEATLWKIQSGAAGHWAVAGYVLNLARPNDCIPPPKKTLGSL